MSPQQLLLLLLAHAAFAAHILHLPQRTACIVATSRRATHVKLELEPPEKGSACGQLLAKAKTSPDQITFKEAIAAIEEEYDVLEVPFSVGAVASQAGQNMGSAKILSLGKVGGLNAEETLALFGEIYRAVLDTPEGTDHPNIRAFMAGGWDVVDFPEGIALVPFECDLDKPENCM
ncbi:hypothetical protein AB1Y20_017470 [Prymnesium parvum]|uniref:Uncharacterized protein n=1 Tax=Prymnesium parvum TaxID=97485 RepID=A0AB34JNJ5_PRYPA